MFTAVQKAHRSRRSIGRFGTTLAMLLMLGLLLSACGGQAPPAEAPPANVAASGSDDLVTKAQQEGRLVFYSSLPESKNAKLGEAFKDKYGIEVEIFRAGSLKVQQKLYEELLANALHADVFHSLYPPGFHQLRNDGHLASYDSSHHAAYPEQFVGPDKAWGTMRVVGNVIMYNTKALGDLPPPQKWEDLLKPEYKGKLASADPTYGGTQFMQYYLWKENYGEDFIRTLAGQDLQMVDSHGALAKIIITGERPIAIEMNDYQAWGNKYQDKAPVEYVYPPENVLVVPGPIAILAKAQHPNAARLFYDFILSKEGQQVIQEEVGAYSARKDASPIEGRPNLTTVDQWQPDWDFLLKNEAQEQSKITELLASPAGTDQ